MLKTSVTRSALEAAYVKSEEANLAHVLSARFGLAIGEEFEEDGEFSETFFDTVDPANDVIIWLNGEAINTNVCSDNGEKYLAVFFAEYVLDENGEEIREDEYVDLFAVKFFKLK